jgi:hypothetical protein
MTRVQEKEFVANALPTTSGQGNSPGVALTQKERRPTIALSSTSPAWFSQKRCRGGSVATPKFGLQMGLGTPKHYGASEGILR